MWKLSMNFGRWDAAILIAITIMAAAGDSSGAITRWSAADGGNGHFCEVVAVPAGLNWQSANTAAIVKGGYLATMTSPAENAFVFRFIDVPSLWNLQSSINDAGPIIGGYQVDGSAEPLGGWRWVTDEPWVYSNWASAQPDNAHGTEKYLQFWGTGTRAATWNDIRNADVSPRAYIVEYNTLPADYNGDGYVDAADYTVWADHFGQTGAGIAGDGNADGAVDAADYTIWADHFGLGIPPAGAAAGVPEVAGREVIGCIATAALLTRRSRSVPRAE